jgi:hypothetical protein
MSSGAPADAELFADTASSQADGVPAAGDGASGRVRASHGRTTITFYLSDNLRNRARAAYRSTSFHEKDASWSEMLTKALLAEVERRERAHNRGQRFPGSDEPLNPGRPIGY